LASLTLTTLRVLPVLRLVGVFDFCLAERLAA
jgi:hypothetical protein